MGDAEEQGALGVLRLAGAVADEAGGATVGFLRFALVVVGRAALLAGFGGVVAKRVQIQFGQALERRLVLEFGVFGVDGFREGDQIVWITERNIDADCFTSRWLCSFYCLLFSVMGGQSSWSSGGYSGH